MNQNERIPRVLTIAGSDSSSGAGLQADLKTFSAHGVYGTTVVTAVTAQNTLGVQQAYHLPPELVAAQLDSVLSDVGTDAVKTGMLANCEIVEIVSAKLAQYKICNLVVDPVLVSTSGHLLLTKDAVEVIKERLFPLALLVTPNMDEAEALTGMSIKTVADMEKAARVLWEKGVRFVLVKGGHLPDEPMDILFDGTQIHRFSGVRVPVQGHGTGCTLSAAIAAQLALGRTVTEAVRQAKEYVTDCLMGAMNLGNGFPLLRHWRV